MSTTNGSTAAAERPPTPQEIAAATHRIFPDRQGTSPAGGLVGADGRAIGGPGGYPFTPIPGVLWGVAVLFLTDDNVGLLHLEQGDITATTTRVAPGTEPVEYIRLAVPPTQQSWAHPWSGVPATIADVIRGRCEWIASLLIAQAAIADGVDPNNPPDGWEPHEAVVLQIAQLGVGLPSVDDVAALTAEPDGPATSSSSSDEAMFGALVAELQRTRSAVAAIIDADRWQLEPPDATEAHAFYQDLAAAVWPNGRDTYAAGPEPAAGKPTDGDGPTAD